MMRLILLTLCVISVLPVDNAESSIDPRIIGGKEVKNMTQFAFQVSLQNDGSHFCGGSIIDEWHIVTAAHCMVKKKVKNIRVVAGSSDLKQVNVKEKISSITIHKLYTTASDGADVAVLKLKNKITTTPTTKSIDLAYNRIFDKNCTVSGWGVTEYGVSTNILRQVNVEVHSFEACKLIYGRDIIPGMLCAGPRQGGKDSCQGDSGGPLVCNNTLVGIVSFGYGCAQKNLPGIYTDVSYYYSWIKKKSNASKSTPSLLTYILLVLIIICNL